MRDAATLIDENAVLVVTDRADVIESLRVHDWASLFQEQRAAWTTEVERRCFRPCLTAEIGASVQSHHRACAACRASVGLADHTKSIVGWPRRSMSSCRPRSLMPLPVLGIPGWWKQNENPDFYSDRAVFRPAKMRRDRKAEMDS